MRAETYSIYPEAKDSPTEAEIEDYRRSNPYIE